MIGCLCCHDGHESTATKSRQATVWQGLRGMLASSQLACRCGLWSALCACSCRAVALLKMLQPSKGSLQVLQKVVRDEEEEEDDMALQQEASAAAAAPVAATKPAAVPALSLGAVSTIQATTTLVALATGQPR